MKYADRTTPDPEYASPARPATSAHRDRESMSTEFVMSVCRDGGTSAAIRSSRRPGERARTRDTIVAPSSSAGKRLRKP
ncbi:hypothetical protein Abr02nite_58620 [Paractinoplanes brasiliensis]|nr:hypothetical protein Abr02nite_58620 [Actinoplanes brasiliensis]